jgi:LysR family transcriptional regulator, nitrogen assimilation regulatory protein
MDSELLDYFLRVSELGSINKAAADLHLSQPTLSRHMALLEHTLGAQLFARSRRGIHLTDAGRLLADRARPLLRQFAILKEQVGERATGHLSIGVPTSWHSVFTLAFVRRLTINNDGLRLRVYEGVSNVLREYMLAGLLDLCIAPLAATPTAGYQQTRLLREPLALVERGHTGLDPQQPVPVSRLAGLNLVLPARPNALRQQVELALAREGLPFRADVETDTLALCLDLASQGIGSTVVPACALVHHHYDGDICWAPVRGLSMTWALYENQARTHSQAMREGRNQALATVAEGIRGGRWFGAEASPRRG